ncbi:MAG: rRNA maturation RNase YbeY [Candidatus Omnitrophica bacterium]|nr:rRNA maturation RNase YbeY [Candidatus Omnitrophota bacterium]MCM8790150.1 rRNA maturation RNase YbeY [Candidatus Omnitrophota bacterium]
MRNNSAIKVTNSCKKYRLNESLLADLAAKTLNFIRKSGKIDLEIVFLDDDEIRKLNVRYKGYNKPTDVLSFYIERAEFGERKPLGEIFISADTARRNSRVFGALLEEEMVRYIIHGILHLFGYDDRKVAQRSKMSKTEDRILRFLCRQNTLSKVLMPR